jgi:hypothetical protein
MNEKLNLSTSWMSDRPQNFSDRSQNAEFAGAIRAGFIAEIRKTPAAVGLNDLDELKREYASLIIQIDRLRPSLLTADVLYRPADALSLSDHPTPMSGHPARISDHPRWSIKEILGHIIDSDREIWWPRIDAMISQNCPHFVTLDQKEIVRRNRWHALPLDDIIAQLMRVRWNYAMRLNTMAPECFQRTGLHLALGPLSLLQIIQLLVAHDARYLDKVRALIDETSNKAMA